MDDAADGRRYQVVVNDEEQYSIWLEEGPPLPGGWAPDGFAGDKEACLQHIAEVWTDLRPRSLRERMNGLPAAG